jgi:hypothetical protein
MFVNRSELNEHSYQGPYKDASYQVSVHNFIWPSGFREEEFLEINQSVTRIAFGGHGW